MSLSVVQEGVREQHLSCPSLVKVFLEAAIDEVLQSVGPLARQSGRLLVQDGQLYSRLVLLL